MRDFSYKMQQMRDFRCKKQGREPGRPKKKCQKNNKIQLNFAPEKKEGRNKGKKEGRKEGGREGGTKEGKREKGKKTWIIFFWCFRAAWSPLASGDQEKIFPDQKKIKPNLPLNLDEIGNIFFKILVF